MTPLEMKAPVFVITGFAPFSNHSYNPSWDTAQALANSLGTSANLLDVTFEVASSFAQRHFDKLGGELAQTPVFFLHLGLAANRDELCLEERAHNLRGLSPDNEEARHGIQPTVPSALIPGELPCRSTTLATTDLACRYNGHSPDTLPRARASEDCGDYVCNALYYHSLKTCEARAEAHALFVHIPPLTPAQAILLGEELAHVLACPTSTYIA
ncbi:MAG: hypothetical protein ACNA8W_13670 [Bradymonadaceae bacterium]